MNNTIENIIDRVRAFAASEFRAAGLSCDTGADGNLYIEGAKGGTICLGFTQTECEGEGE